MHSTSHNASVNHTVQLVTFYTQYGTGLRTWFGVVLFFGFTGGIISYLLAATILTRRSLRSGSGILIAHALLTEGTLLFISYPLFAVQTFLARDYPPSPQACRGLGWEYYVVLHATHWSEILIPFNRFTAVLFPHKYKLLTSRTALIILIIFCWAQAIVCETLPVFHVGALIDSSNAWHSCLERGLEDPRGFLVLVSFNAYIPIGLEGTSYFFVTAIFLSRQVRKKTQVQVGGNDPAAIAVNIIKARLVQRRFQVIKMLFAGFVVTAGCSLLTPVIAAVFPQYMHYPMLSLAMRAVLVVGYSLHPLIFIAMSADYRRHLGNLFRKRSKRKMGTISHAHAHLHGRSDSVADIRMRSYTLGRRSHAMGTSYKADPTS